MIRTKLIKLCVFIFCTLQIKGQTTQQPHDKTSDRLNDIVKKARVLVDRGEAEDAERIIDSILTADQNLFKKYPKEHIDLYRTMSTVKQHLGKFRESFDYIEQGILLAEKYNLPTQLAALYFTKAKAFSNTAHFNEAMELYIKSATIVAEQGDSLRLEQVYNNMGNVLLRAKEFDQSIDYYRKASDMAKHRNDDRAKGISALNLAVGYIKKEEKDSVVELFNRSLFYFNQIKDQRMLGVAYHNYGQFMLDEGHTDEAEQLLEKSLAIRTEMDSDIDVASTKSGLGKLYLQLGHTADATQILLEAEKLLNVEENTSQLRTVFANLVDLYASKGAFEKAYEYQQKLFEAEKIIHNESNRVHLLKAASDYELSKRALALRLERENHRKRQISIVLLSLLAIAILFVWFVYYKKRQKRQATLNYKLKELEAEQQILFSAQNERKRISRDLHDDLGTTISAIKLLVTNSYANDKGLLKMVEKANEDVRDFFTRIASSDFEDKQLTKTIQFTIDNLQATGQIDYRLIVTGEERLIPNHLIQPLSRIAVELLLNVAKHAQATECVVQLFVEAKEIQLMVEDNGKGFTMEKRPKGMGIDNIYARTKQWNGEVHYSTGKSGTTVIVNVPY